MILVNAVDSFCDMKLSTTTGNGEKKLYLSTIDSMDFVQNYLGVNILNGTNLYQYNDEIRARIKGYKGFIKKSNLENVFIRSNAEYRNRSKYRINLDNLRIENEGILNRMHDREYFTIDCSISENRIYIGSKDKEWFIIPKFCIPRESKIRIVNVNDKKILEFEILLMI